MARLKVRSRSRYDVGHLYTLINVPTKYQLPTPYISKVWLGQDFKGQGHYCKVKGQI